MSLGTSAVMHSEGNFVRSIVSHLLGWAGGISVFAIPGVVGAQVPNLAATNQAASASAPSWHLSRSNYLNLVIAHNERVQVQELEFEATRRRQAAEKGIFEPALVLGALHEENARELNSQAQSSAPLNVREFIERNNRYNSALEFLVPNGAKFRLGSTISELNNNFQDSVTANPRYRDGEYETFVGVNLVQPLLKNAGPSVTLAGLRIAAQQSEIAWQDYRKQLSQTLAGAEAGYWGLYLAQEQLRFFEESVKVAETVLSDARARAAAGKSAEIDILQAEADLAMRRNGRNEAAQKLQEARARTAGFIDSTEFDARGVIVAAPPPPTENRSLDFLEHWAWVFTQNPDYASQRARLDQEGIRVAFAQNQRLPQLDLKASYGLNGLGATPGESWDKATHEGYDSWNVGLELRIPLGGGVKERNELAAARLRKRSALLTLKELETMLRNTLNTALEKVRYTRNAIGDYEATVKLNENLFKTELARLEVGRVEARKVLEVERDLLQSKLSALAAEITYQQSLLELDVLNGTYLPRRQVSRSRAEVTERTQSIMSRTADASGAAH